MVLVKRKMSVLEFWNTQPVNNKTHEQSTIHNKSVTKCLESEWKTFHEFQERWVG
jgi:hypothetical protein